MPLRARSIRGSIAAFGIGMLSLVSVSHAAQEVHGTSDAFAGDGVAIAWGVLRGASEETTMIVMRIAGDSARYARVAADGIDPFTKERKPVAPAQALTGVAEVRISRKQFADFPRTEFLFFGAKPAANAQPDLIVYYLGVPDTTPEFRSEAALGAYLDERIAKLRGANTK